MSEANSAADDLQSLTLLVKALAVLLLEESPKGTSIANTLCAELEELASTAVWRQEEDPEMRVLGILSNASSLADEIRSELIVKITLASADKR